MSGDGSVSSLTCSCGERISTTAIATDALTSCPNCGASINTQTTTARLDENLAGAQPVLPYQTPPSYSARTRPSRWTISGKTTRRVTCGKCGCGFRYELNRKVRSWSITTIIAVAIICCLVVVSCFSGFLLSGLGIVGIASWLLRRAFIGVIRSVTASGAASVMGGNDAAVSANKRLRRTLNRATEPVPCPKCGWYQADMVREVRSRFLGWTDWVLLAILLLAPVVWYTAWRWRLIHRVGILKMNGEDPVDAAIIVAGVGLLLAGILAGLRWVFAFTVDPNAEYPAARPPYPDSPIPTTEAEYARSIAAQTSKITASRQGRPSAAASGPRRIVPPRMP